MGLVLPPGAFRLLLAYAVLASHISNFDVGRLAVLLFFYLSGFWIADIWSKQFGPGSAGRFYISRYLRIVPLFLIATVAAAAARHETLGFTNFTLVGLAWTGEASDPTRVSWSLDIELQFYLLAPVLLAQLSRAPVLILGVSLPIVALGWWVESQVGGLTVLKFLPAFLLGALTHQADWRPSRRTALLSLGGFLALTALIALTPMFWKTGAKVLDRDIFGLFWMLPLLPYVAHSLRTAPKLYSRAADKTMGDVSYPLYLIHPLVIFAVEAAMAESLLSKALIAVLATVLAVAVYLVIDRPLDSWRRRVTARPNSTAALGDARGSSAPR